eukprot:6127037-Alexandrium_andersonii.AAC.1
MTVYVFRRMTTGKCKITSGVRNLNCAARERPQSRPPKLAEGCIPHGFLALFPNLPVRRACERTEGASLGGEVRGGGRTPQEGAM